MTVTAPEGRAVDRAADLLAREIGIACPPERRRDLERAVAEACRRAGVAGADELIPLLPDRPALLDDLARAIAVGETYLFRDPSQFDVLRREVLPGLLRAHGAALRVWSAGCASGEEAYSLAILLAEAGARPEMPVLGTDVSRSALRRAQEGRYGEWSFRGVPAPVRDRSFSALDGRWVVRDDLRERVRFEWLNLASDAYPSPRSGIHGMHVIFCRNVLLYLTPQAAEHVARRLAASLAPDGWLFVSPTDPPLEELAPLTAVATPAGLAYRPAQRRTAARGPLPEDVEPIADPGEPAAPRSVGPRPGPEAPAGARGPGPRGRAGAARDASLAEARERIRGLVDRGSHDDAAGALERATRAFPVDAELRYLAALLLLERGRDAEAAVEARRALYLDPALTVAAVALGSALRRIGDLRGARRAYRAAAQLLAVAGDRPWT